MKLINLTSITEGKRIRKDIGQAELDATKRSIVSKGLLHPIVLKLNNELLAGGRRTKAITQLHEEAIPIYHDNQLIPAGQIPYVNIADLSPADFLEAELEENIIRSDLSWLEEVEARALIHELRLSQNPQHTVTATGREVAELSGKSAELERHDVARALIISKNKTNPKVLRAKNASEAFKAILDEQETKYYAKLQLQAAPSGDTAHKIIHG